MAKFYMKFFNDGIGGEERIEFDAADATEAIIFAHEQAPHRSAELWEGNSLVFRIRRRKISQPEIQPLYVH